MQFCPDAEYRKCKITLNIAGGTFIAQARNLQIAGWKQLWGKEDSDDEQQDMLLPVVKKGQMLHCEKGEIISKKNATAKTFYRCDLAFCDDRHCSFRARQRIEKNFA